MIFPSKLFLPTVTVVEVFTRLVDLFFSDAVFCVQSAYLSIAGYTVFLLQILYQLFSDQKGSVVLTQNSLERISWPQASRQITCPQFHIHR